jgi:hypothetical protein
MNKKRRILDILTSENQSSPQAASALGNDNDRELWLGWSSGSADADSLVRGMASLRSR